MNASILPGVIEMTGHYRGVFPGPVSRGRPPLLPTNEILARACSKRRTRFAQCNDAGRKPYNTAFETRWRCRLSKEFYMAIVTTDSGLKYEDLAVGEGAEAVAG